MLFFATFSDKIIEKKTSLFYEKNIRRKTALQHERTGCRVSVISMYIKLIFSLDMPSLLLQCLYRFVSMMHPELIEKKCTSSSAICSFYLLGEIEFIAERM